MSTVAVAGVGLMVVCSSSFAAVMLMGDKKGTPSPKYDDNSSSEEDGDEENEDENDTPTPSTPSPTPSTPSPTPSTPSPTPSTPSPTPIDCEGSWSANWSSCSSTCEGGQQTKTWTTTTWPQHGGNPCPSPRTLYQDCGSGSCSVNWSGPANTSGTPVWEEFSNMKFYGTKLSSHSNTELAQCKQKCIDNTGCGGITTKTGNKCHLYGGDAMPNPSPSWFTSYTLTRG